MTEKPKSLSRIQRQRRAEILDAALENFSLNGYRGASINEIAKSAGMSTPRLLYHFSGKEALYSELLKETLRLWMGPVEQIAESDDPVEEICDYVRRKLAMSQEHPRESRLFAGAVLLGGERASSDVFEAFRDLFAEKVALLQSWIDKGLISEQDPYHLFYSIWATTQHYADFETQISELSPHKMPTLFADAEAYLVPLYRRLLTPAAPE